MLLYERVHEQVAYLKKQTAGIDARTAAIPPSLQPGASKVLVPSPDAVNSVQVMDTFKNRLQSLLDT